MTECHPGQRWISNTEPELGLGIVFEVQNRHVVMNFPASDERRTYALDNAPLTRVQYRAADRIRSEDGAEIIVEAVEEIEGCVVYQGIDARGRALSLHEIDLDSFVQFNRPLDRLFTGQIDKASRFRLRSDTLGHQHRHRVSPVFGLVGPRVQLLGHQLYIADEVSRRHAPRVLLADEVGLGKTIEAGLILHRLLLNGRVNRALIVVPTNLVHQWLIEMLRRFNLRFSILDDEICEELEASGEANPFESAQLVLTSLTFLIDHADRHEQACAADWDLLIVDEAHHLQWTPEHTTPAYDRIERLATAVPGLLLLTATPEQLGVEGHFARLRLLDPNRYHDLAKFLEEERRYGEVNALVERLADSRDVIEADLEAATAGYIGADRIAVLRSAYAGRPAREFMDRIVGELLEHHGTGRVLFRNCRDSISGFPERRLHAHELEPPAEYLEADTSVPAVARLTPETLVGDDWLSFDPRVEWLAQWLASHRTEKVLVICVYADTAQTLEAHLRSRKGLRSAVFHEGMELVSRDRAAAYFADTEDDAQALFCSEIGSEGRNFQFARHLVLFDLPPNPDLLEQRIGRLDRIGQSHTVEIHIPWFRGTAQAVLFHWLHEGLDAFVHICPTGPALIAEFSAPLEHCMAHPEDETALALLIEATRARALELTEILKRGRDRLLERNSFDRSRADAILSAIATAERADELRTWLDDVFSEFGVEHEENDETSLVVHPGDHMSCHEFPGLPEGGLTVTFDRAQAQSRDDMHFLTWEHPMVTGAIDMVLNSEFGNAGFGVVKAPGLNPGSLLVEALFVIVCPAPRGLQVEQFLPQSSLRLLIDAAGEDATDRFPATWFNEHVRDVPPSTAHKVIAKTRDQISGLLDHAAHLAEVAQETIVEEASTAMTELLQAEIDRLRSLAKVNPNVREEEIVHFETSMQNLERYVRAAQLKLDAIRVVIAT
ncbi:MAG: RNA polymerase-associated protein RapA [Gammaproteobacteria bacterium]|nr:RNA polymerase-associated protein RapA [Gammaproteobacteria bacterium]